MHVQSVTALLAQVRRQTVSVYSKRWQSRATLAEDAAASSANELKTRSKQCALYVPTGDADAGKSVVFAVQPFVDLPWLIHESEEQFATNLRLRGYDPTKFPSRKALLHDAKELSAIQIARADVKQQQQFIADEMAKLRESLGQIQNAENTKPNADAEASADEQTRTYAQSMRQEGIRLRTLGKEQAVEISTLEQRVILPALSLPNRLSKKYSEVLTDAVFDDRPEVNANIHTLSTSPSPYMHGLSAEAEFWLLNTLMNDFINNSGFIPLTPPSLYQAVVAEGCTVIDPMVLDEELDENVLRAPLSPAYAVLFPPSIEQNKHKAHETRTTYLLCHPGMPMGAFLANAEFPSVSLPAKFVWSSRMHLSTPLSRHYKNFLFSQPNVVGWTTFAPEPSATHDRNETLNEMLNVVREQVRQALTVMQVLFADDDLRWTLAPANQLFNDEMLRYALVLNLKPRGQQMELARCSSGGTFISKRLKILHALDKDGKKPGGQVRRNFPADYGFLECNYGLINLSHVASLCPSKRKIRVQ